MNYPPKHHQEKHFENALELIKRFPLATLITSSKNHILSTHTPLIYSKKEGILGRLVGHMDKYNPQIEHFKDPNHQIEIIFHGPETYISPSYYSTTQLPTWNYFKVHLKGKIHIEKDPDRVKQDLISMTSFLEGENPKYILTEDNPRMSASLNYIIGFHIDLTSWEGKYKISQDKNSKDRESAKQAILNAQSKMKEHIEFLYQHHQTKR